MVLKTSWLLISLLPLAYFPNSDNPYELPKFIIFVLGALLVSALATGRLTKRGSFDKLTRLVLVYWLTVFLADIFGADPRISILGSHWRYQGFVLLSSGVAFFLALRFSFKKNKKPQKSWAGLFPLSVFLVSLIAILQGLAYYVFPSATVATYNGRIVGSLGNPNSLGGWLVITAPFLFLEVLPRLKPPRLTAWILLAGITTAVLFSGSRGAVLAAGTTIIVWLACRTAKKPLMLKIVYFLAGLGLVITTGLLVNKNGYFSRQSSFDNRLIIWKAGLRAVVQKPVLGWGQENFEVVFPKERLIKVDNAHNLFLETAVSSGILGLLFYLGMLFQAFKRTGPGTRLSLIAFLVRASFNPLSISEIAFFWFLIGQVNGQS